MQTPGVKRRHWGDKCGVMKRPQQPIASHIPAFETYRDAGLAYRYLSKNINRSLVAAKLAAKLDYVAINLGGER